MPFDVLGKSGVKRAVRQDGAAPVSYTHLLLRRTEQQQIQHDLLKGNGFLLDPHTFTIYADGWYSGDVQSQVMFYPLPAH